MTKPACAAGAPRSPPPEPARGSPSSRRGRTSRARASFARRASGRLDAHIDVPFTRDFPGLIAHELEHVVEQIEGVNLRRLAERPASGVDEVAAGRFETSRAREAGRAAALEVQTETRLARARVLSLRPSATVARLRP